MALRSLASELCRGGQVHCGAGVAMSHVLGVADALGWVLALVARAAGDRAHLDSTRSLRSLSTHARVAAGPGARSAARRRGGHWARDRIEGDGQVRAAADRRAPRRAACDGAHVVATLPGALANLAGALHRRRRGAGRDRCHARHHRRTRSPRRAASGVAARARAVRRVGR